MGEKLSDKKIDRIARELNDHPSWLDNSIDNHWLEEAESALRTLRRERAQLAARVEELEAENQRLDAALHGRLHGEGPEAA